MLTHFSLFSGIGGIDLAAEWDSLNFFIKIWLRWQIRRLERKMLRW